jgi:hypothetical protein
MICANLAVKTWNNNPNGCPATDTVRPGTCESCLVEAGRSGALRIHGHGTAARWLFILVAGDARRTLLVLRRFRCLDCGHVMTVAPREVRRWFQYSVALIAYILALWGVGGVHERDLRADFSVHLGTYSTTTERWPCIRRWVARHKSLFGPNAPDDVGAAVKKRAQGIVHWLDGYSPPSTGIGIADRVAEAARTIDF